MLPAVALLLPLAAVQQSSALHDAARAGDVDARGNKMSILHPGDKGAEDDDDGPASTAKYVRETIFPHHKEPSTADLERQEFMGGRRGRW